MPGAVLTGVGMRLLGLAVSTYFAYRLDHSNDLYGALGLAVVMMLFLFLVARIFVAAQFLNATLYPATRAERRRGVTQPPSAGGITAEIIIPRPAPPTTSCGRCAPTYIRPNPTVPTTPARTGRAVRGQLLGGDEGERGRDGGVARDPAEVALDALADRDVGQDPLRAGPAAERLDELGADPRDRAADGQARGEALASGEEREDRDRGHGAERPGLHDRSNRDPDPVARAVDRPEEAFLVARQLAAPGLGEADEEQDRAEPEPGDPSRPHPGLRSRATRSGDRAPVPIPR